MRPIKFRAWDGKKMSRVFDLGDIAFEGFPPMCLQYNPQELKEGLVLMQYTGLKDKNGVEIYEGDILKLRSKRISIISVCFEDGSFKTRLGSFVSTLSSFLDKYQCEIVDNIHQNPELIKSQYDL